MKIDKNRIKVLLGAIKKSKKIIAKERDTLRGIHDELGELLSDIDEGVDYLERGIDEISQIL